MLDRMVVDDYFLNGIISERFGYRMTMIYTMIALIGTIFIPFFSNSLEMFVAGGILQGSEY